MAQKKDILIIEDLASFEKLINRDSKPYDINMMVMPGTLEDKHKNVDPHKGIRALRRQFNLVYIFLSGTHDVQLVSDQCWLKPNDLVIVPENMVYASQYIRNCTGYCVHFKTEFIQPLLNGNLNENFPFFDLESEHIINVSFEESKVLQGAFKDIISEYNSFSYEKDYILRHYIHILLLRIREIYRPHVNKIMNGATRNVKLCNRFKHLVEKNFIEVREVQAYAEMMNIAPKHLSEVVKSVIGKSPRKLINDVLTLEAKVLLGSTDLSISEIAHYLRFDDQSHFSNFIKLQTGLSPSELRKKL